MKKFLVSAVVAGLAVSAFGGPASAQRYLDDYVGRRINAVKDDLRSRGFVMWDVFRTGAAAMR